MTRTKAKKSKAGDRPIPKRGTKFDIFAVRYEAFRLGPGLGFPWTSMHFSYSTTIVAGKFEMEGPYELAKGFQIYVFKCPKGRWHAFDADTGATCGGGPDAGVAIAGVIADVASGGARALSIIKRQQVDARRAMKAAEHESNEEFFKNFK